MSLHKLDFGLPQPLHLLDTSNNPGRAGERPAGVEAPPVPARAGWNDVQKPVPTPGQGIESAMGIISRRLHGLMYPLQKFMFMSRVRTITVIHNPTILLSGIASKPSPVGITRITGRALITVKITMNIGTRTKVIAIRFRKAMSLNTI